MHCALCGHDARNKGFSIENGSALWACSGCGAEFLHPVPAPDALKEKYSARYYDAWGTGAENPAQAMKRATARHYLSLAGRPSSGAKILDIGCATGYLLEEAQARGYEAFGVEISDFAAAEAKKKFGDAAVHQGGIETAPFTPGSFDVITMIDFLEHVPDPLSALVKARELLAAGGMLLIVTPECGSLTNRLMGRRWTHYKSEHLFYFTRVSLEKMASETGLSLVRCAASKKAVTVEYIYHQFAAYPHPLLTPLSRLLRALLPKPLRRAAVYLSMGEVAALFRRA